MTKYSNADANGGRRVFLALAGPTACGKSELAAALAAELNAEIISVDSGAVYQDMNIGTATPPPEMLAQTPHHLINITPPNHFYSVGRFFADAQNAAAGICARGKTPLFVGGAMMYFNALLRGLAVVPPPPPQTAERARQLVAQQGAAAAHAELARADPTAAANIAATDGQRIARALAVFWASKTPLSAWQAQTPPPPFGLRLLRLIPQDGEALRRRICARLDSMWAAGLQDETARLLQHWKLSPQSPPLRMAGYRQAARRLLGEGGDAAMRQEAQNATCQLAKRQRAWLRRWQGAGVLDPFAENLKARALAFLQNAAAAGDKAQ